jgi:flagellar hook-associated protein 2
MLTAAGIGSGIDIESLVTQLMALERRPLDRLEARKGDVQVQISANGQLRSAISRFQAAAQALADRDTLGGVEGASSDEDVVTVSSTADAQAQSHVVQVVQLATFHRLTTDAFADENTAIGTGTLDITIGTDTLALAVTAGNNTLAQVRDAINAAPDNPGVTASIVTVDAGARLLFTANDSGLANQITVTPGGGLTGMPITEVDQAFDASIKVNGFDVTSASNSFSDVITGATLTVKAVGTATVGFAADSSNVADAATEFVDSYNFLRGNARALRENALKGDSMLLTLERSINARLGSAITMPDTSEGFLFEAGISFTEEGDLSFDSAALAATMAADPTRVLDLFGAPGTGLAIDLDTYLEAYLVDDGILDARTDSLESRDRSLDQLIDNVEYRLQRTEERLRAEFTALDTLLGQMQVTSSFLSQQLLGLNSNDNSQG